jgi:hypothetical protein
MITGELADDRREASRLLTLAKQAALSNPKLADLLTRMAHVHALLAAGDDRR